MKRNHLIIIGLILAVFLSLITAGYCKDEKRIKIIVGDKEYLSGFIGKNFIKVKNLQKIFGFNYLTGSNTGFVRINGMNYSRGLVFRQGSYFVAIDKFLQFFLVSSQKVAPLKYKIKDSGILNMDLIEKQESLVAPGKMSPKKMSVINVNGRILIEGESFANYTGKKLIINKKTGVVLFDGKKVQRWLVEEKKVYLYMNDLENVYGNSIQFVRRAAVTRDKELKKKKEKAREIRENIRVSWGNQNQYGTGNPAYPVVYRIWLKVRNNYRNAIQINSWDCIMFDTDGNKYQGDIFGYSESGLSADLISNEKISSGSWTAVSYLQINGRDDGYVSAEFLLPRNARPKYFIFQFKGVELFRKEILRTFIP